MNKAELIKHVSRKTGITQGLVAQVLDASVSTIRDSVVLGDFVNIPGLGVFRANARKSRTGYNPKTQQKIEIPAKRVPSFTPARGFKEAVAED